MLLLKILISMVYRFKMEKNWRINTNNDSILRYRMTNQTNKLSFYLNLKNVTTKLRIVWKTCLISNIANPSTQNWNRKIQRGQNNGNNLQIVWCLIYWIWTTFYLVLVGVWWIHNSFVSEHEDCNVYLGNSRDDITKLKHIMNPRKEVAKLIAWCIFTEEESTHLHRGHQREGQDPRCVSHMNEWMNVHHLYSAVYPV